MDALGDFVNWAWARHHNPLRAVDGTIPRSRTSSANVTFFPEDATTLDRAVGCSTEPAAVPRHRGVGRP